MSFTGIEFFYFLPVVFLLYWLLPRRAALQNAFLLAISYLFYLSWSPRLLLVLLLATVVDYVLARDIEDHPDQPGRRKAALALSLCYNLGQLAFFKYSGFFAESLSGLFAAIGVSVKVPVLRVVLPLGISFYTFQKLSYILDVYYGRLPACRSPLDFATYVAFFPQLTAGPIVRGGDLLPQYAAARQPSLAQLHEGATTFLLGFFKKAFVADYLAQYVVDPVFAQPASFSTAGHWLALMGYCAQVFCDFSGYSEMAIGTGRLFGIELPQNFDYPFLSKTLMEFWRRWHITLNTWFFDYVYGPLTTGEGRMRGRLDLGFMVVFLLSGLWHGARWTFVLWGALHGLGLIAYRRWDVYYRSLCRKDRKYVALRKGLPYAAGAWFVTQLFFLLTLIPFRAPSLAAAGAYARALVSAPGRLVLSPDVPPLRALNLAVIALFMVGYHLLALPRFQPLRARFFALPALLRGVAYGLLIVYLLLFVPLAGGTFIYAQF